MRNSQQEERLIELLSEKATYGLTEADKKELKDLLEIFPERNADETLALTAAAISLSSIQAIDEMPANLRLKVLEESKKHYFAGKNNINAPISVNAANNADQILAAGNGGFFGKFFESSFGKYGGWAIAAAACIALAVLLSNRNVATVEVVRNTPVQTTPTIQPGFAEQREQILSSAQDKIQTTLTDFNPKQPKNITGDVVWSNAQQKGFLHFHGLPVNDKTKETYQLWIFDAAQNAKTPIDGGVFDVDANGDVIIPINAKLKVKKPTMFAVTVEKPGGVVVSDLSKVMTVAKI